MRKQFICGLVLACAGAAAWAAPIDSLNWLAGCWASVGGEPGSGEHWTSPAVGTMLSTARTIKNGKTVGWEFVVIREIEPGKLAYVAKPHNQAEAAFPVVKLEDGEVVFENPSHDFPQRIIYKRNGEGVDARIEGMSKGKLKGIDYPLRRAACQ